MTSLRLVLIRHGQTEWAQAGRVAGHSDIELSPEGRTEVSTLAKSLRQMAPQVWYCSPMRRTRESSLLLRKMCPGDWPPERFDERLKELDFGQWEGELWQEVYLRHGDLMRNWGNDWVNRAPPGGERFRDQAQRCAQWLRDAVAQVRGDGRHFETHSMPLKPQERRDSVGDKVSDPACLTIVAVSHAGSIRALICHCLGWPLERAMSIEIDTASLCVLDRELPNGNWLARRLNVKHWFLL